MMTEEMKELGGRLKQRRTEMNLSLREAENATSIRLNYLQAIEEGDDSKLISPVYAQGFIRQYAAFLGLDGEGLIKEHPELFKANQQEFAYGIGTLEGRENPGAGVKWFPNALWVTSIILILAVAWYVARFLQLL